MGGCCEAERNKFPDGSKAETVQSALIEPEISQKKTQPAKIKLTIPVKTQSQLSLPSPRGTPASADLLNTATPLNRRTASNHQFSKSHSPAAVLVLTPKSADPLTTPIHSSTLQLLEQYTVMRKVQSRRLCVIYLMVHKETEQQVVIKKLETGNKVMKEAAKAAAKKELEVLCEIDHLNVLKMQEVYQDSSALYIVSERLIGGAMLDPAAASNMSEWEQAKVIYQLLSVLKYCHSKGIFHLNIRLDNLLIQSTGPQDVLIKLFGFGAPAPSAESTSKSALYAAPEVLNGGEITEKADVWSCGVLLAYLLTGKLLFANTSQIMQEKIDFRSAVMGKVTMQSLALIEKMLDKQLSSRPTAEACMQDPWLLSRIGKSTVSSQIIQGSLQRLRTFHSVDSLLLAAVKFMASYVTTAEQVRATIANFKAMDRDGDGQLSKEELIEAYSKSMAPGSAARLVEHIMTTVDTDHNGHIGYSEFLAAMESPKILFTKENLAHVFSVLTSGKNTFIRVKDLQTRIKGKDEQATAQMWEELCRDNHINGDTQLRLRDFVKIMMAIASSSEEQD
jgi:calcium-dependent protein kinase